MVTTACTTDVNSNAIFRIRSTSSRERQALWSIRQLRPKLALPVVNRGQVRERNRRQPTKRSVMNLHTELNPVFLRDALASRDVTTMVSKPAAFDNQCEDFFSLFHSCNRTVAKSVTEQEKTDVFTRASSSNNPLNHSLQMSSLGGIIDFKAKKDESNNDLRGNDRKRALRKDILSKPTRSITEFRWF